MGKVDVIRLEKGKEGTFGVLRLDGQVVCVTLEPPDRGNQVDVSCIPTGDYVCRQVDSPSFGRTYEVEDVPGRSRILFHQGNVVADTHGCILLGRHFGVLDASRGILQSRAAFRDFLDRVGDQRSFKVRVEEPC
ncbi:hypothetical protein GO013_01815 [Pseudodesulfovibrio sp. JC047]|uniref:DUF5675 family protein n=1 Tax=Pseudodesulfovibrio sp. JC047 TaxID=2683199 RepID=UPI0013D07159|nr:DUF5675 family protein [Pseudodesulfovibrio sp. JC047]NDV18155.1 hypothetical protein [Pseudodesulfovibrio sp. JC047]